MTFTITSGASTMIAYPIASCMREKPGPEVAVMASSPVSAAPMHAQIEAISSSIWTNTPPTRGSS
jgi:hypothetical protein